MAIRVRSLEVIKTCAVSPHLKRITLCGDDLADFPIDAESGYVKALFHPEGLPVVDADSAKGAVKRSYTVRAFRSHGLLMQTLLPIRANFFCVCRP